MTEGRDVRGLEHAERAFDSPSGKAATKIVSWVFGGAMLLLVSLLVQNSYRGVSLGEQAQKDIAVNRQEIALVKVQSQRTRDQQEAMTEKMQTLTILMTKLQDQVEHVQEVQREARGGIK